MKIEARQVVRVLVNIPGPGLLGDMSGQVYFVASQGRTKLMAFYSCFISISQYSSVHGWEGVM